MLEYYIVAFQKPNKITIFFSFKYQKGYLVQPIGFNLKRSQYKGLEVSYHYIFKELVNDFISINEQIVVKLFIDCTNI